MYKHWIINVCAINSVQISIYLSIEIIWSRNNCKDKDLIEKRALNQQCWVAAENNFAQKTTGTFLSKGDKIVRCTIRHRKTSSKEDDILLAETEATLSKGDK